MNTVKSRVSIEWIRLMIFSVFLVLIVSSCDFFVPNKPPYIKKILPADSALIVIGQVVNFQVNAYDVDGSVVNVTFTAPNTAEYMDDSDPYEFDWSTAGMTIGMYHVEIKAVDDKDEPYIIKVPIQLVGAPTSNAGKDTTFTDARITYVLQAEAPGFGQGTWTIVSGIVGQISDIHDPKATFTGQPCSTNTLRWTVSNGVNQVFDEVTISFFHQPSQANAGIDQLITDGRTVTVMQAVTPIEGSGRWRVLSGGLGTFSNDNLPNATFTGQPCKTFILIWSVSTACAESSDTVEIRFDQYLIQSDAGPDQIFSDGRKTTILAANDPGTGSGRWSVVSGSGGVFENPSDPNSAFTGELCLTYVLRWTISNLCGSTHDEITVSLNDIPSRSEAGPDQYLTDGSVVVQMNAAAPENGTGVWTILPGGSGSFSEPNDPKSMFFGVTCHSYVLRWTVSTACSSSFDEVTVVLSQVEIVADAGPDVRISDGFLSVGLQGNEPGVGTTGTWSVISGSGGVFSNTHDPGSGFTGIDGQIYRLKWTLSGACMENSDQVIIAFISGINLTDPRDGKIYHAIKIGSQVWMSENLNYSAPGSYAYNNTGESASVYGRLYDWNTAITSCPTGWHLPSDPEWRQLEIFLGMDAGISQLEWYRGQDEGQMLKETGSLYWASPNSGATNISGFTARPGGYRAPDGTYGGIRVQAGFWTSSENSSGKANYRALHKDKSQIGRDWYDKGYGFSVRCLKN